MVHVGVPLRLEVSGASGPGEALKRVREQVRALPRGGLGYGLLRYLSGPETADRLASLPQAEVSFNYLGQLDPAISASSLFGLARESSGPSRSPRGARRYLIEVTGLVTGGDLQLTWRYSERLHLRSTVEGLARGFVAALRSLLSSRRPGQERLDGLLDRLARGGVRPRVEDAGPLSPAQQGILFHALEAAGSGVYVGQMRCLLEGPLRTPVLERAWERLVARHAVLRTAFAWEDAGEPLQVVLAEVAAPLEEHDLRGLPPAEQDRRIDARSREDRGRPFDLSRPPLMRLSLFRLDEEVYRLVWSTHHLLLDGWSKALVIGELLALYEGGAEGKEPLLGRAWPFLDYIRWLEARDPSGLEPFWRRTLADFTSPTPLGIDGRFPDRDPAPRRRSAVLSAAATGALHSLARRHQATLNAVLEGVWGLLLSHNGGEEDVVFGAVLSGRPEGLPDVESRVGMFINTLPLRLRIDPGAPVSALLRQAQERQLELLEFQHSSLPRVQGWSGVPRGLPLFESLFVFESFPVDESVRQRRGSLRITDVLSSSSTSYPLALAVVPGDEVLLRIHYDPRRLDDAAIARMLGHYLRLLESAALDPGRRADALDPLGADERQQVLCEWNDTRAGWAAGSVHGLFEAQARRSPGRVALVFEGEELSYGELDARASALARRLHVLGVGPETRVGVALERGLDLVVGLLAVLKAGGAYVPLDPAHPRERLAFQLADAGAELLLTQPALRPGLSGLGARVVCAGEEEGPAESSSWPGVPISPRNLAYVMYTSGTTGQPKGVMVPHGGVHNHLLWRQASYRLGEEDRLLQKSPLGFDASVWEIFWPLSVGARLVLARPGGHQDSAYLAEVVGAEGITFLHAVPTLLRVLLEEPGVSGWTDLRRVTTGGEPLAVELRERFFARLPGRSSITATAPPRPRSA